jgi:hypothetical protein
MREGRGPLAQRFVLFHWQFEAENRAATLCILGFKVPVLGAGEVTGDGEPQTCPTAGAAPGGVDPVEAFENVREVLRRDPGPRILDDRLDEAVSRASHHADAAFRRSMPKGIVEED